VGRVRDALGIRLADVGATVIVAVVVELNVATGTGAGAQPLSALSYLLGGILAIPVLFRRKWPLQVLIACSVLLFIYYSDGVGRDISPAPLLSLPLYDAALAGFLAVSIVIPAVYMAIGLFVVGATEHQGLITLVGDFLPSVVVLALAVMLGEVVRSRRALAAETADRLRLAAEERESEAARRVAEERLRIARELHDTIAHSMATITVQAGSALHILGDAATEGGPRRDLGAAPDAPDAAAETKTAGLDRLAALTQAVRAAGAAVSVTIEGEQRPLPPRVDHAAYRILQESLTNVLRHAGPDARAAVCLRYAPGALVIRVTDDGIGTARNGAAGTAADGTRTDGAAAGGATADGGAAAGGGQRVPGERP
jgi:signal transduction histidine kinase